MRMGYYLRFTFALFSLILISACSRQTDHQAQGYIEGRYTYLATSVSGTLEQLLVERGTPVRQGQLIYKLDPQPQVDLYNAAVENLKQAIKSRDATAANLSYAKITYERYQVLVPKHAIQVSALDDAKSRYQALVAQLAQADANIASTTAALTQAQWTKEQKIGYAPVNGFVFDTYYRQGEYTEAGKSIVSLLAPENIKAIFYIPEGNLGKIRLGDLVEVQCDGCTKHYTGQISFISPSAEYTPPVIYSNETSSKLIYRVEARFKLNDAYHMHPGQPVNVVYHDHRK